MSITRRSFLKLSGAIAGGLVASSKKSWKPASAVDYSSLKIEYGQESTTICPFCSVGCGMICHVNDGQLINVEGDPDHPINQGTLCTKGNSIFNLAYIYNDDGKIQENPYRVTKVFYRAPYSGKWEVKDWDWALDKIASRIKETRDETFETTNEEGVTVNRTTAMAHLGSAMCNNEETYLFQKRARAFGMVNIDHCARL